MVRYTTGVATLWMMLATASPAGAQAIDDAAEPAQTPRRVEPLLDEVVVTAQKREQGQQDVGIAVSAFSADVLSRIGVEDTTELADLVPGFTYTEGRGGIPIYTLRGVGFNLAMSTASSTVGIYVDEMNIPYSALSVGANLDIDRVEVVKGPQGTLYGRNTTGGAVNYISARPGDAFEAGLRAEVGRFWRFDAEAYVSGPLTDRLGMRFAIRNTRADGAWQYDYTRDTNDELGFVDKTVARWITDWQVSDSLDLSLTVSGWRDRSDSTSPQYYAKRNQAGVPVFAPSPEVANHPFAPGGDARATAFNPERDYDQNNWYYAIMARADWALSDALEATLILSHQDYHSEGFFNTDGLNVSDFDLDRTVDTDAQSLEARLTDTIGSDLLWVAGYWYSQDSVDSDTLVDSSHNSIGNGGMLTRLSLQSSYQDSASHAGFAQLEWQFTPELRLTAGGRYTWERRDHQSCLSDNGDAAILLSLIALARQLGVVDAVGPLLAGGTPSLPGGSAQQQVVLDAIKTAIQASGTQQPVGQILDGLLDAGLGDAVGNIPGFVGAGECASIDVETNTPGRLDRSLVEDNIAFRLALDWTPNDDILIYGSVARGFKSGTFSDLATSTSDIMLPVTQEELWAYEIGVKSGFFGNLLTINAAAFYYDYRDKQLFGFVVDPIFGPLERLDNVPEAEVMGAELEIRGSPVEGLFLSGSIAYTHTEVITYVGTTSDGMTESFAGNEFAYAPQWELAAMIHYTHPLWRTYLLSLGLNANYSSASEGELSNDPVFRRDGYVLADAQISFAPDSYRWEVRAFVNNFLDELYFTSQTRTSDTAIRYTGMPRTYGLSLTYHFQ